MEADWRQIERDWAKYVASAKLQWGKLSEDQLRATRGRHDVLSARVSEAYAIGRKEADTQISQWHARQAAR